MYLSGQLALHRLVGEKTGGCFEITPNDVWTFLANKWEWAQHKQTLKKSVRLKNNYVDVDGTWQADLVDMRLSRAKMTVSTIFRRLLTVLVGLHFVNRWKTKNLKAVSKLSLSKLFSRTFRRHERIGKNRAVGYWRAVFASVWRRQGIYC